MYNQIMVSHCTYCIPMGPVTLGAQVHNQRSAWNSTHTHNVMQASDLHCTATVSEGPDTELKKKKKKTGFQEDKESDFITSDWVYYNNRMCALTVVLTPAVAKFFNIHNSSPHVSLAKANDVQWENLAPWVTLCSRDCTWEDRGEGIQYSPWMQTYRCPFQSSFLGEIQLCI